MSETEIPERIKNCKHIWKPTEIPEEKLLGIYRSYICQKGCGAIYFYFGEELPNE